MKNKITKADNLGKLIEEHPEANELLFEYGLYCGSCFAAGYDTLEQGAQLHGFEERELEELIDYLNQELTEKEGKEVKEEQKAKTKKTEVFQKNKSS